MSRTVKFAVKTINPDLLSQEVGAVITGPHGFTKPGFQKINPRRSDPFTERTEIGHITESGKPEIKFFADPGELRLDTPIPLSAAEDAAIDALLIAHDWTQLSASQTAQDQDETDFTRLRNALRDWDSLNNNQKFNVLRSGLRLVLREAQGDNI